MGISVSLERDDPENRRFWVSLASDNLTDLEPRLPIRTTEDRRRFKGILTIDKTAYREFESIVGRGRCSLAQANPMRFVTGAHFKGYRKFDAARKAFSASTQSTDMMQIS